MQTFCVENRDALSRARLYLEMRMRSRPCSRNMHRGSACSEFSVASEMYTHLELTLVSGYLGYVCLADVGVRSQTRYVEMYSRKDCTVL